MKKEMHKFTSSNILEGMTSIDALIKARNAKINDRSIRTLLIDKSKYKSKSKEISYLKAVREAHGFVIQMVDSEEIDSLTIGSTHGGIIAICSDRTLPSLDRLNTEVVPDGFYVMIEGIEDPYNFGYALRSLYAAGVDGIILPPRNWMGAAGVVARASAGASELFPMYTGDTLDAIKLFREQSFRIVCADKRDACPLYSAEMKPPLFLIIGGEKRGISRAVRDMADFSVKIEYGRPFSASLSAASAATILAYEVFRQCRKND